MVRVPAKAARPISNSKTISVLYCRVEEVLDLFFEDLELPDMVESSLKEAIAFKPRRAGFTTAGAPTNINVGRSVRNSFGRRIALRRPKQADLDAIADEVALLEAEAKPSPASLEHLAELRRELRGPATAAQIGGLHRSRRYSLQPLRAHARAERQCGHVLPDGCFRFHGRARKGSRQAIFRPAASVSQAAIRAHRYRLHPPHPSGSRSR